MLVLKAKGRGQRINVLAFSPAGDALLAAGPGSWLDVWRFDSPTPERFFQTEDLYARVIDAEFSADGTAIIAAYGAGGLRVQPLGPGAASAADTYESRGSLLALTQGPDGRIIGITQTSFFPYQSREAGYQCWAADGGRFQPAWFQPTPDCWRSGLAVMPGGRWFIATERTAAPVGGRETALVVRSTDTGEHHGSYDCPYAYVDQLVFSPDGERLLARSGMGIAIWPTGELSRKPQKVLNDNRKHFTGVAFHPSGRYLAATSNDKTVKLLDAATWQLVKTFTWQVGRLRSVAFSPDGTRAAVGSDTGKVVVWDVDL
jgi:WD40 repeat protein